MIYHELDPIFLGLFVLLLEMKLIHSKVDKQFIVRILLTLNYSIEMYDKDITQDSKDADYFYQKVDQYNKIGKSLNPLSQFDQAMIAYQQSLKLSPNNDEAYNSLGDLLIFSYIGVVLQEIKRHQDAINMFDKAININQKNSNYYFNKGQSLKTLENYDNTIIMFDQAIQIDPKNYQFYLNKEIQSFFIIQTKQVSKRKRSVVNYDQINPQTTFQANRWITKCNQQLNSQ
ncbi:hypothetical protein pb186bvf_002152 [Paramecium bursaria]